MEQRYSPTITTILCTLTLCVVFCGPARSQEISSSDVFAPIGSTYHLYAIQQEFPWDTLHGADVVWDYPGTQVDSVSGNAISMIPLSDAPNASSYPDADRVIRSVTSGNYTIDRFYEVAPDQIRELGSVGPVLSYDYDIPLTLNTFPMQLGDTTRSNYCVWSDGAGSQFHFCGDSYVTFDGIGTLILPYGTFNNVKHVTQWHQSVETTMPDGDTTIVARQQWFLPYVPFPVLEVTVFFYPNGSYDPFGWLMDGATVTAVRENDVRSEWSISPIPTIGPFTVLGEFTGSAKLEILALDGRVVGSHLLQPGTDHHQFSASALPNGTYLVRLNADGKMSTRRIFKISGE